MQHDSNSGVIIESSVWRERGEEALGSVVARDPTDLGAAIARVCGIESYRHNVGIAGPSSPPSTFPLIASAPSC